MPAKKPASKVGCLPAVSDETREAQLLEAALTEPDLTPADQQEADAPTPRESRRQVAVETPFGPESLCGSWALYHSPSGSDTYAKTVQALIVAEPQAGVYLVELYDVIEDEPREQKLVKIDNLLGKDDEGGSWKFYDDHDSVRKALWDLVA
jgi:hypothetical protein